MNTLDITYLKMAIEWSKLSYCVRRKVGSLIVKNGMIISDGYNGTPSKYISNICEDENNTTKWYTLHSEANAILKCAKYGGSCDGATLYTTLSPCKECCKLIIQSGIKRVVYIEKYHDEEGLELLMMCDIDIKQISL